MTANGWIQIGAFLVAVLALTKPLGVFMARVFNREWTFLDPVMRPVERLVYRLTGVDEQREMRWTQYTIAMMLFTGVSMLLLYGAVPEMVAAQPAAPAERPAGSRLKHRRFFHDQHQLAGLHARDDHELPDPDGVGRERN